MYSRGIYRPRDKKKFSKIERHVARHMLAWGFGDFKGGEIFPWRNYPQRNCPRAKISPPLYIPLGGGGVLRWLLRIHGHGVRQRLWANRRPLDRASSFHAALAQRPVSQGRPPRRQQRPGQHRRCRAPRPLLPRAAPPSRPPQPRQPPDLVSTMQSGTCSCPPTVNTNRPMLTMATTPVSIRRTVGCTLGASWGLSGLLCTRFVSVWKIV